jgi:integrase
MESSRAIMIPQAPIVLPTTSTTIVKQRKQWDHHIHYKYGKRDHVIPLEEVIQRVEQANYNKPYYLEYVSYFWVLYYLGLRGSECNGIRCSQCKLTDTHFIIDVPRKKGSATPDPINLRLTWAGVDKIVALWKKRKDFKATTKKLIMFHTEEKYGKSIRTVVPTKDVWLFLNVSDTTGNKIVKDICGKEWYRHALRMNRCTEIGDLPDSSIVAIKSYTGIKSTRIIENNYLGMSKKALERTESGLDALQPKSA